MRSEVDYAVDELVPSTQSVVEYAHELDPLEVARLVREQLQINGIGQKVRARRVTVGLL